MKKKFILFPLVCALLYVVLSSYSEGPGITGNIEGTGATNPSGCSCHNPSATPAITVTVQLLSGGTPVTTYVGGNVYTIKITGTQTSGALSLPKFGFQVDMVKQSGAGTSSAVSTGTMSGAPTGTHVYTIPSTTYTVFEHYNGGFPGALVATTGTGGVGTTYVESITWTAPSSGTGNVVLYGVINAVDGDGSDDPFTFNDHWNTATPVTICEAVNPITGPAAVCVGSNITLSDVTSGGTWSSSDGAKATVTSGGVVTGVGAGAVTISYSAGCSGIATYPMTVNPVPAVITGTPTVCVGSTTVLGDLTPGGTWSSVTTANATVVSGTVTGVAAGTSVISYTLGTGCAAAQTVTVNPQPTAISGTLTVCPGATSTLSSTPTGGTWTSSNGNVTIGSGSGIVTGVNAGTTSTITYTSVAGCIRTATVTVNTVPTTITGTMTMCPALTTTLNSTPSGGTWSSGSPGIATVGPSTGIVTGVSTAGGTSLITYTGPSGCSVNATVTVNPSPGAISGTAELCSGTTTTLSDAGGGTWASGSPGIATIGSGSGLVTGIAPGGGTSLITYTLPTTGCAITRTVTVDPAAGPITGTLTVCPGATTALSDGGGGTWTSGTPATATIDGTGMVTGVSGGTSTITYALPVTGCSTTAIVTVNPSPSAIGGTPVVCVGSTTTLTDAGGGTWLSSNPAIATIGSSSGLVTGITAGPATITYTLPGTGCTATTPVTVNPLPGAIGGTTHVCVGLTTTLTDGGGGTWTSGDITIATVGSATGVVTGVSASAVNITYTLPGTGCQVATPFTVNPLPAVIGGTLSLCAGGATTTLTDAITGGTWTSSNTSVATIGSSTGNVTTGIAGNTTITYTLPTGCIKTAIVTVNILPPAISGPASVCAGSSVTLTDGGGGTWISGTPGVATIGSGSGSVTGVSGGTTIITYTLGTGCSITRTETVNPLPTAISGPSSVCVGQTITLTDAGGGTWASGSGLATVGSSTGVVTGVAAGTVNITYTLPGTGCIASMLITVNALSPITGLTSLCSGTTTTLNDATAGGSWVSSNTAAATIGSSTGLLTAIAPGTTIITYTLPSGCVATSTVNVISSPAAITGANQVCLGSTTTLTDAGGGIWSSGNPAVASVGSSTGIVTGVALGTTAITYSLGTGCTVFTPMTVNPVPVAIGGGPASVCIGATTTFTDGTPGGTWTSSNTNATVGSTTGIVTGVTAGTSIISYTVSSTGCIATKTVTVNALPVAIGGSLSVCIGSLTTLTDATPGGTWTSSTPTVASIGSVSGVVNGISLGTTTISYTVTATGCRITATETVNPVPVAIGGTASACIGSGTTLTDGTPGGTWTSGNIATATVGSSTGFVIGVAAGTVNITYTLGTGCIAFKPVTINPLPVAIGGTASVCVASSTTLTDGTPGGTWSSGNPAVAAVGSATGIVNGISAGTATITYTLTGTGCVRTTVVTVNPIPLAISGTASACVGATTTLSDITPGGGWTSSNIAIATVGSSTGVVTGVTAGLANITYALGTGCNTTRQVTINPLPFAISGADSVCVGATTTLTDGGGGTWVSASPAIATIGSTTGVVSGVGVGTSVISYTLGTGCMTTTTVTVNPVPTGITGLAEVCAGLTTTLSDVTPGGTWSSDITTTATIGSSTGVVTGVSSGISAISYALSTGCAATVDVTVDPLPAAIGGPSVVCVSATITLTDGGGGTWVSSNPAAATIGSSTGIVSGIAAGTATITYTLPTGCVITKNITVNPLPVAGTITGLSSVCATATITLADAAPGGVWNSVHTALATVGSTGIVTGVAAGTDSIRYSVTNSCGTDVAVKVVTVNPQPAAGTITGLTVVCVAANITLADAAPGGVWSSSNANATIGSGTGIVNGVTTGITTITYSVTNVCGTATTTQAVTVNPLPDAGTIAGADSVCEGTAITLTDTVTSGTWSSGSANATVDVSGVVTGVSAGTATITYSVTNSCGTATATQSIVIRSHADCNVGVRIISGSAAEFKVYPNPSDGSFTVEIPGTPGSATVTIMDLLGKVIETRTVSGANIKNQLFNLNNIASGTYLIKVNAGNKTYREKIVIR